MHGLIELIFDSVPDSKLDALIWSLVDKTSAIEIFYSEKGNIDVSEANQGFLTLFNNEATAEAFFIKTNSAVVGSVVVNKPVVRVLRFNKTNEVMVIFSNLDLANSENVVTELADGAGYIADTLSISDYYCGFEPATDPRTRLFTKAEIGPFLKLQLYC